MLPAVTLSEFTNDVQALQQQVEAITAGDNDHDISSGLATAKNLYMRDAAYVVAINRVVKAVKTRGWV